MTENFTTGPRIEQLPDIDNDTEQMLIELLDEVDQGSKDPERTALITELAAQVEAYDVRGGGFTIQGTDEYIPGDIKRFYRRLIVGEDGIKRSGPIPSVLGARLVAFREKHEADKVEADSATKPSMPSADNPIKVKAAGANKSSVTGKEQTASATTSEKTKEASAGTALLLGRFATIEQVTYKNGVKHVYGVTEENGKKKRRHISFDAVLENYGHEAGKYQGKEGTTPEPKEDLDSKVAKALEAAEIMKEFDITPELFGSMTEDEIDKLRESMADKKGQPDTNSETQPLSDEDRQAYIAYILSYGTAKDKTDLADLTDYSLKMRAQAVIATQNTSQVTPGQAEPTAPTPAAGAQPHFTIADRALARIQARAMSRSGERQKRNRFLKVAGIIGGLAVAAVLQYKFNIFHDFHGGQSAIDNTPNFGRGPRGEFLAQRAANKLAAQSAMPTHSGSAVETIRQLAEGGGKSSGSTAGSAKDAIDQLAANSHHAVATPDLTLHSGETIWGDNTKWLSQHGYATTNRNVALMTNATLKMTGLTEEAARHLPVGYKFPIPREILEELEKVKS